MLHSWLPVRRNANEVNGASGQRGSAVILITVLIAAGLALTGPAHLDPATLSRSGGRLAAVVGVPASASQSNFARTNVASLPDQDNRDDNGKSAGTITLPPFTVGGNLETLVAASLDRPAASDLAVTITSSDPTKLLLSPLVSDPTGSRVGRASITGTVARGQENSVIVSPASGRRHSCRAAVRPLRSASPVTTLPKPPSPSRNPVLF